MIKRSVYNEMQQQAAERIQKAGIVIKDEEVETIEIVDFGLNQFDTEGAAIFTMVNTERISAKVLVLFANQTEPEHWHPPAEHDPGKEETVRAIAGELRFYIPGDETLSVGFIPQGKEDCYTARKEIIMTPGDQLTMEPGTKHWFQAGPEGAVLYSFSTCVRDAMDRFSDPNVERITKIIEDE